MAPVGNAQGTAQAGLRSAACGSMGGRACNARVSSLTVARHGYDSTQLSFMFHPQRCYFGGGTGERTTQHIYFWTTGLAYASQGSIAGQHRRAASQPRGGSACSSYAYSTWAAGGDNSTPSTMQVRHARTNNGFRFVFPARIDNGIVGRAAVTHSCCTCGWPGKEYSATPAAALQQSL